jgi:hypothetical protein
MKEMNENVKTTNARIFRSVSLPSKQAAEIGLFDAASFSIPMRVRSEMAFHHAGISQ